jgi:HK97 family phage major capsid protein
MSIKVLERLREERDQARSIAIELASAEDFDAESSAFKEAEARAVDLDAQIARLVGLVEARQAADAVDGRLARASTRTTEQADNDVRSLGEQFVGSDVFRAWNGRGSSSRLEVRALPTGVGSIGSFAGHTKINLGFAPNVNAGVADLATVINVSNNAVDYIRWAPKAGDKALVVAEGTDKPLIEFVPTPTSVTLDTIAAATQFTRQLAQDEAALVSLLNTELQREVSRAIEAEAAKAVGAATLPTAAGPADGGLLAALRVGYGKVQAAGYSPNGFLVHPDDLAGLDIAVMQTAGTGPDRRAA